MVSAKIRTSHRSLKGLFFRTPQRLKSLYPRVNWKLFEEILCYRIEDKDLFVQALLHRSFIATAEGNHLQSNERLEFLGDAILDFVVGEYLYTKYPEKEEGELTVLRSKLVNKKALVFFAKEIDLRRFIIVNATTAGVAEKGFETIIGDSFEAVIAALYLDGGIEAAKNFVIKCLVSAFAKGYLADSEQNYKSALLELSQSIGKGIPRYITIKEEGPDHDRTFTMEVTIENESYGVGVGKNKKEAEQAAAEIAIQRLKTLNTTI